MAALSDDLLKRIVEGSGRVYTHEAKAMAREIIEWRQKAKNTVQYGQGLSLGGSPAGQPHFP